MSRWDDDEALMADLGEALGSGSPVPDHRRAAARAAFTWRTIDEELMRLCFDSLDEAAAAVRGNDDPRLLSFEVAGLALELEVGGDAVWGQAIPARAYEVTIENSTGERRTVVADESGIFSLETLAGAVRLVLVDGDLTRRTDWILL